MKLEVVRWYNKKSDIGEDELNYIHVVGPGQKVTIV